MFTLGSLGLCSSSRIRSKSFRIISVSIIVFLLLEGRGMSSGGFSGDDDGSLRGVSQTLDVVAKSSCFREICLFSLISIGPRVFSILSFRNFLKKNYVTKWFCSRIGNLFKYFFQIKNQFNPSSSKIFYKSMELLPLCDGGLNLTV